MTNAPPEAVDRLLSLPPPRPWEGGLPWNDPEFSERMLAEHLSQGHDAASRRSETIDAQVAWLHVAVLGEKSGRVLDLGCGAGLHTLRLAALGHACVGIDFAPAAIRHARTEAAETGAECEYRLEDVREADLGTGEFDLAMMLYGDLDTVPPAEAADLLERIGRALRPGGTLVLDVHTRDTVRQAGDRPPAWRKEEGGLFSPEPHLVAEQSFWLENEAIAIERIWVVEEGRDQSIVLTTQSRIEEKYPAWLDAAGFESAVRHPGYGPAVDPRFVVLTARSDCPI